MKLTNYEWLRAVRLGTLCWIAVELMGITRTPAAQAQGTVNNGTAGQIGYYATTGTTISGETSVPISAGGTGATSASVAISNLLPGISSDGSNGIIVTGNAAAASVTAETIGGFRFASQYQTGAGNNGIANASSGATNQTVIADPSYGATEAPSTTSLSASPFALEDDRQSMKSLYYHNPGNNLTYGHLWNWPYYGWYSWAGETVSALFDGVSANSSAATMNVNYASTRPGWTLGNNNISGGGQGWYSTTAFAVTNQSNSAGLAESVTAVGNKYGLGDFSLFNCEILNTHNGATAASDEGTKCYDAYVFEDTGTYTGTCSSGCATGSTSIKTTAVTDNNSQGVGQYVIDSSNTPVQGKFTNIVSGLGGGSAVTVSVSSGAVTESVAWGSVTAAVGTPLNASSPYSTSETFTIAIAGGTGGSGGQYDTTHLACWAGNYHDCAVPSAVGSVSGGTQSVTMPLRRPHAAGSYLFQGGMAGYGFEATSFTENPNGQPLRYLFDVVGATSSTTLQVGEYEVQTYHYVPITNNDYGCFNVSSGVTNGGSGSTITAVWSSSYCAISIGTLPYHFTNGTFYFSGLSDSSLNNVACTNVAFQSNQTTFTCTISGLSGSHTDTTGGTASLGANSFKLWPMAETLDVQNETLSPPQMDGTLQLEPNIIPFQSGDTIEQPHHVAQEMNGSTTSMNSYDPYFTTGMEGFRVWADGAGVIGGGTQASNAFFEATNHNPDAMYVGSGGILTPPNGILIGGPYAYGLSFTDGPIPGEPLINVYPNSVQMNDPNYCFYVWQVYNLSSADLEQECPNTGNLSIAASGSLTLYSGTSTVNLGNSALQINGNTVIPTTVTGYHGNASGVSVPLAVNWTNSAGALLCDDGNGNVTTSGCTLPTATTSVLGGVKPDNTTILNNSGAISEAPNYFYQGPWTGTSALGLAVASRIDGWGFTVPAPVVFSHIYGISNTVDTTGTDYYSLTILCGQGPSAGSCTGGVSQGAIICSPSAGSNMPAADSLFTSSCSQGTVELYPENYYVMLFTGNATVGKLMGTAANSVVGSYFSINIGGCSSSSGVVSGTCTLTGVGTAVVYSTVPPSFSLH